MKLIEKRIQFESGNRISSSMAFSVQKKIVLGFLSLVLLSVTITIMKFRELMNHHEVHVVAKDSIGNIPIKAMKSIGTEPLEHEIMFTDTLKDCMPNTEMYGNDSKRKKECKMFVPEGSKERIAILAPPGKMDASLLKFIRIVLMKGKKGFNGEIAATHVEVIPATNMVSIRILIYCNLFSGACICCFATSSIMNQNERIVCFSLSKVRTQANNIYFFLSREQWIKRSF